MYEGDQMSCGSTSVDTRNSKYQARVSHTLFATSNKSHKFKDQIKIMKKRESKFARDEQRATEISMMKQMQADNKIWAPVDQEDRKHQQKEAAKRKILSEKMIKKNEKNTLKRQEDERTAMDTQNQQAKAAKSSSMKSWGKGSQQRD